MHAFARVPVRVQGVSVPPLAGERAERGEGRAPAGGQHDPAGGEQPGAQGRHGDAAPRGPGGPPPKGYPPPKKKLGWGGQPQGPPYWDFGGWG